MKLEWVNASVLPVQRRGLGDPCRLPGGLAGGYTPGDIATAYGVNPAARQRRPSRSSTPITIRPRRADLSHFDAHYGLPAETATSLRIVNQTGAASPAAGQQRLAGQARSAWTSMPSAGCATSARSCSRGGQYVQLLRPGRGREHGGRTGRDRRNSYGGAESNSPASAMLQNAYNHPGKVILASTGDNGMFDWDFVNNSSAQLEQRAGAAVVLQHGRGCRWHDPLPQRGRDRARRKPSGTRTARSDRLGLGLGQPHGRNRWRVQQVLRRRAMRRHRSPSTPRPPVEPSDLPATYRPSLTRTRASTSYDTTGASGWQHHRRHLAGLAGRDGRLWALAGGSRRRAAIPRRSLYKHFKAASRHDFFDVTGGGNGLCDAGAGSTSARQPPAADSPEHGRRRHPRLRVEGHYATLARPAVASVMPPSATTVRPVSAPPRGLARSSPSEQRFREHRNRGSRSGPPVL